MSIDSRLSQKSNLKQLLIARSEWFARELELEVAQSEFADLTPAEARLLAHMAGKPCNMAELARRLGISRQAVHKAVNSLIKAGILQLTDDPERGNSKLVLYTDKGREVNRAGAKIIERIEQRVEKQLAAQLGVEALGQLKVLLAAQWE